MESFLRYQFIFKKKSTSCNEYSKKQDSKTKKIHQEEPGLLFSPNQPENSLFAALIFDIKLLWFQYYKWRAAVQKYELSLVGAKFQWCKMHYDSQCSLLEKYSCNSNIDHLSSAVLSCIKCVHFSLKHHSK